MFRSYRIDRQILRYQISTANYRKGLPSIPTKIFESLFVPLCFTWTYAWPLIGALLTARNRGSVEIQVMASRKWWISRTVAERTFWYVSNGSAESRHLQAAMA
jgi:hypothetical protein